MSKRLFFATLLSLVLLLNIFPIWQGMQNAGILFYQNAYDEPGYLNFEAGRAGMARMRFNQVGEGLVLLGHQAGLSGGWINLILDAGVTVALALLLRSIFRLLGHDPERANLLALLLICLPGLYINVPFFYGRFYSYYLNSELVRWVVMPQIANWLPMLRSPEPQVSYLLLALGVYLALSRKTILPLLCVLPFQYPYVSVPVAFIVVAVSLERKYPRLGKYPLLPLLLSYGFLAAGLFVFYSLFSDGELRGLMTATRLPFFSVCGALCLLVYALCRRYYPERLRFPLLALCAAPLALANQQIISGWISQPVNYESYFGIGALALLLTLALAAQPLQRGRLALICALAALVYLQFTPLYGDYQFTNNILLTKDLRWSEEAWQLLRDHPERVAIDDLDLAASAGLAFPRQRLTAFAYQKSSILFDEKQNVQAYVCARERIRAAGFSTAAFERVFSVLDEAYRSQARDFIFVHHRRSPAAGDTEGGIGKGVLPEAASCPDEPLTVLTRDGAEAVIH